MTVPEDARPSDAEAPPGSVVSDKTPDWLVERSGSGAARVVVVSAGMAGLLGVPGSLPFSPAAGWDSGGRNNGSCTRTRSSFSMVLSVLSPPLPPQPDNTDMRQARAMHAIMALLVDPEIILLPSQLPASASRWSS